MAERPIGLDEFPIHQAPVSMRYVATSDRNAYDRSIFQVFDHDGDRILITGFGSYPNVGVTDAYATLAERQVLHAVRASDALGDDRMALAVGPVRIEVQEPLRRIRLVCEGDPHDDVSLAYDVLWEAALPAVMEPHHLQRTGDRQILEGRRFVQAGTATGTIRAGGVESTVTPDGWSGTRDRSWGLRPIAGEEPGRFGEEHPMDGFWWLWIPMRFDDHFLIVIVQEDGDGYRNMSEALRVWDPALARPDEQLGWPFVDLRYRPGTRYPDGATVHLTDPQRRAVTIEIESRGASPLGLGAGYPPDPEWTHGSWRGRGWVERKRFDVTDPAVTAHVPFGLLDHAARVTEVDGDGTTHEGWALFEHGSIGRHAPTGMADFGSVAPPA